MHRRGMSILRISTHSLTRRLTVMPIVYVLSFIYFNSQPHKEADSHSSHVYSERIIFQLTASQGG